MKELMKKIMRESPVASNGTALACLSLANLLPGRFEGLAALFLLIGIVFLILFISRIFTYSKDVIEEMNNPITASMSGLFPMAIMVLSVHLKPSLGEASSYLWFGALFLHIALILYFTVKFLFKFKIQTVYSSWFIVYVGIVAFSMTAPVFGQQQIGEIIFWFGLAAMLPLSPLVTYRYLKCKNISEPIKPLFSIFASPFGLFLAGYVSSINYVSPTVIKFLMALCLIFYIISFIHIIKCFTLKFSPNFSAFAFPFVISAVGITEAVNYLELEGILVMLSNALTIIATILVAYVLARYENFFVGK